MKLPRLDKISNRNSYMIFAEKNVVIIVQYHVVVWLFGSFIRREILITLKKIGI